MRPCVRSVTFARDQNDGGGEQKSQRVRTSIPLRHLHVIFKNRLPPMAFPKACFPGSIGNLLIPGSLAQHPAESKLPQFDPATPVMLNFRPALTGGKYIP